MIHGRGSSPGGSPRLVHALPNAVQLKGKIEQAPGMPTLQLADHFVRDGFLRFIVMQNNRAILRATIIALAVGCGGIVDGEEDLQQGSVRNHLWVKGNLYDFCVPGRPCANIFIAWVVCVASGVP